MSTRPNITWKCLLLFTMVLLSIPSGWRSKLKRCSQMDNVKQMDNQELFTRSIYLTILKSTFVQLTLQSKILHQTLLKTMFIKSINFLLRLQKRLKLCLNTNSSITYFPHTSHWYTETRPHSPCLDGSALAPC